MALNNKKPARDVGYQIVNYIRADFTYADNGTVIKVGTIPANSVILKAISGVFVNVAFNAGTTNVLDIGTFSPTLDDDFYATDLALGTIAFVPLDEVVTQTVTADTEITATPAMTGTAASAGSGIIVIAFAPKLG